MRELYISSVQTKKMFEAGSHRLLPKLQSFDNTGTGTSVLLCYQVNKYDNYDIQ